MGWYFSPTHQIQAALHDRQIRQIQVRVENRLSKVIATCKTAKEEGEAVWNALLECPKTETVQAARANLRKGLTDIQTQLTLFEGMLDRVKQDEIEADFKQAATSLQNLLELVEVANSYVHLNKNEC